MGYRVALTVEELGEFAAAITKGKPKEEASEELADLLILILATLLQCTLIWNRIPLQRWTKLCKGRLDEVT